MLQSPFAVGVDRILKPISEQADFPNDGRLEIDIHEKARFQAIEITDIFEGEEINQRNEPRLGSPGKFRLASELMDEKLDIPLGRGATEKRRGIFQTNTVFLNEQAKRISGDDMRQKHLDLPLWAGRS